jgi:hypothetical protein
MCSPRVISKIKVLFSIFQLYRAPLNVESLTNVVEVGLKPIFQVAQPLKFSGK